MAAASSREGTLPLIVGKRVTKPFCRRHFKPKTRSLGKSLLTGELPPSILAEIEAISLVKREERHQFLHPTAPLRRTLAIHRDTKSRCKPPGLNKAPEKNQPTVQEKTTTPPAKLERDLRGGAIVQRRALCREEYCAEKSAERQQRSKIAEE